MSKYVANNTVLNYKIPFVVDGELVSPSAASITLTKNDGTVVGGINDTALTIPALATSVVFSISGANNTSTLDYEIRYITVKFTYASKEYYISDYYVIRDNLRLPVTYDDVRNFGSFASSQISDDQIDIFLAYSQLQSDVTEADLDALLNSGSALIPHIQMGIKAKALLNSLNTIETSLFQSEQADNTLYKRFANVDFNSILDRLNLIYSQAVAILNGTVVEDLTSITFFTVITGTDPVTGV